ncbi:ABC transporter, ATP-binding protein [Vibrio cholerae]|nr:ABC transporter, ATP-binding protein [Vibrio cholerae]
MFKLFEGFTDPFPKGEPQRPPNTLWAFCRHTILAVLKNH